MKIIFSFALAFVLSLACLPFVTQPGNKTDLSNAAITKTGLEWQEGSYNGSRVFYTYLGSFPQSYVGGDMCNYLNSQWTLKYRLGNYNVDMNYEAHVQLSDYYEFDVYSFNGEKYAVYQPNSAVVPEEPIYFTSGGGGYLAGGGWNWFKFEPIKWYALTNEDPNTLPDGTRVPVMCANALLSRIDYYVTYPNDPLEKTNFRCNRWPYTHLRTAFVDQIAPLMGFDEYEGKLITKTGHGYSFADVNGGQDQSRFGSEYIFPPSIYELDTLYMAKSLLAAIPTDFTVALIADSSRFLFGSAKSGLKEYVTRTGLSESEIPGAYQFVCEEGSSSGKLQYAYYRALDDCGIVPMATLLTKTKTPDGSLEFGEAIENFDSPQSIACDETNSKIVHIKTFEGWKFLHDYTSLGGVVGSEYNIVLDNNIDCGGTTFSPIENFSANLDGQNFALANLYIQGDYSVRYDSSKNPLVAKTPTGLFGSMQAGGALKNVIFLNINVTGYTAAGLVGSVLGEGVLTLQNIFFQGSVSSQYDITQDYLFNQYGSQGCSNNTASALVGDAYVKTQYVSSHYGGGSLRVEKASLQIENCQVDVKLSCSRYNPNNISITNECSLIKGGSDSYSYTDSYGPHYGSEGTSLTIKDCCFDVSTNNAFSAFGYCKTTATSTWWQCNKTGGEYFAGFDPSIWFCSSKLGNGKPYLRQFSQLESFFQPNANQLLGGLVAAGLTQA